MAATTTAPTKTKKPRTASERTPLEHAQRRIKEQIAAVKANTTINPDTRDRLQNYLSGVNTLLTNAALVPGAFAQEPYATVIALGKATLGAGDLFRVPTAPK